MQNLAEGMLDEFDVNVIFGATNYVGMPQNRCKIRSYYFQNFDSWESVWGSRQVDETRKADLLHLELQSSTGDGCKLQF